MYDLKSITSDETTEIGNTLRTLGAGATSMEEVADRIVRYLCSNLVDEESGQRSCVLVRFFKTHPYRELDSDLQCFVREGMGTSLVSPDTCCLTLLATVGEKAEWNSRAKSVSYKIIPLTNERAVAQIPMMSRLISQFGLEVSSILDPDPTVILDMERKTYNTFYVPDAVGSPYIPVQEDFVMRYRIKSVLGFGGILISGALFTVILFSKTHIPRETAKSFKTLAPNVKQAVLPFV